MALTTVLRTNVLASCYTVIVVYYAALLPRRRPHIASHSVCPSVRLSVCPVIVAIGNVFSTTASVTSRHLANYNDTHVLFGTHRGPHIVRPSRPHKLVLLATGCDGLGSTGSLSHCIYMFIHLYVWFLCEK